MDNSATTAFEKWQEAINLLDWPQFTFALLYGASAFLAYICARSSADHRPLHRFWLANSFFLLFIGIDNLLCISTFTIEWLRAIARLEGWYGTRRSLQYEVLAGLGLLLLLLGGRLSGALDTAKQFIQPAIAATALLACLFLLRTVSFHDTDAILQMRIAGQSAQRILEIFGLGFSVTGSVWFLRNY